ncbi:uncharacterized protein [Branchiostoma lanceolatum]|uniref:uncharacterized protein n=1 Tax=Branchiostoma lanceolatum TaxID=7740 RepID=UPI00345440D2
MSTSRRPSTQGPGPRISSPPAAPRVARSSRRRPDREDVVSPQHEGLEGVTEITTGMRNLHSETVTTLPDTGTALDLATCRADLRYLSSVASTKRCFRLMQGDHFAVADCSEDGILKRTYCIIERRQFEDDTGSEEFLFACTCKKAAMQTALLTSCLRTVKSERLAEFAKRERARYCIHSRCLQELIEALNLSADADESGSDDDDDEEEAMPSTSPEVLQTHPRIVAVYVEGTGYGLVTHEGPKSRLVCRSCTRQIHNCCHVHRYRDYCRKHDVPLPEEQRTATTSKPHDGVSYRPIPYPTWPDEMMELKDKLRSGLAQYPEHLVPSIWDATCKHGNPWDTRDPVKEGWVTHRGVTIHDAEGAVLDYVDPITKETRERVVYFRPTTGNCTCKLPYDGQEDLVFNFSNKAMYAYNMLTKYMHFMIENRTPLRGFHRACQRENNLSKTNLTSYNTFLYAYNSFERLLNIDWTTSFQCPTCRTQPEVVIMDGITLGFRKDLIPELQDDVQHSDPPVINSGSRHQDRVVIKRDPTRVALRRFAGVGKALSLHECREMEREMCSSGHASLSNLVRRLRGGQRKDVVAPKTYRDFLIQVSRNTPACGTTQVAGSGQDATRAIIKEIAEGLNIKDSVNHGKLSMLQQTAPVISDVIDRVAPDGDVPADVRAVLLDLVEKVMAPYQDGLSPDISDYPAVTQPDSPNSLTYSFFPSQWRRHGDGYFTADVRNTRAKERTSDCRKESRGHPTLTAGVFTLYCQHAICYGFEVMLEPESPKYPFRILKSRFSTAPSVIIYDNACQLHSYCLNRDPGFFQNSRFFVDRLHFKNHKGCSKGYCLDMYKASFDILTINSQINEQANSGLRRIEGQLSYMNPRNFLHRLVTFLAVKNLDKL